MATISAGMWTLLSAGNNVAIDSILYGNTFAFFTKGLSRSASMSGSRISPIPRRWRVNSSSATRSSLSFSRRRPIRICASSTSPGSRRWPSQPARFRSSTTLSRRRFCRILSCSGPTSSFTRQPNIFGGHGDLLGGAVVGSSALIEQIRAGLRALTGATLSPLDAFLILRGLKTLEVRMERHSRSALEITGRLERHPSCLMLHIPVLRLPEYARATPDETTGRPNALELGGGVEAGMAFMNRLGLVVRAVSLGNTETLVQHPASMTHATSAEDGNATRQRQSSPLVRRT